MRAKPFAFTREQLNGICVDPKSVPVARAVFASAATPIYFAPLVMRTFAGQCGYQPPDGVEPRRRRAMKTSIAASAPNACCRSSTPTNYPYLHLADGALADNLGARAILDEVALGETVTDALRRNGFSRARRMLFIVVDARTGFDPTLRAAARAAGHQEGHGRGRQRHLQPLQLRDHEPHARAREALGDRSAQHPLQGRRWRFPTATSSTSTSWSCSFERVKDAAEREYLDRVPTAFTLSAEQIIRLRRAAHLLVDRIARAARTFSRNPRESAARQTQVGASPTRAIR